MSMVLAVTKTDLFIVYPFESKMEWLKLRLCSALLKIIVKSQKRYRTLIKSKDKTSNNW